MDCSSSSSVMSDEQRSLSFLLEQVAGLNEDGVYELSSGKSREAIQLFQEAWESLMEAAPMIANNADSNSTSTAMTNRIQIPHLEDDLFYIYPCAVSYTPSDNTITSTTLQFECAIVLFNLALAFHQQGKKLKKEGFLRRALQYYQQCQQALQQSLLENGNSMIATPQEQTFHDDLVLLTLAVMNNQASIEYELPPTTGMALHTTTSNTTTNGDSFQKLWQYSMHAILTEETTNFSMVEQSQIHEFVQNAMVFRLQRPCAAPTA